MTTTTTATMPVGAKGADYVHTTGEILAWLLADKRSFVYRYIAHSSIIGKIVTREEIALLHRNNIGIGLIYEQGAADVLKGAAQGASDGAFAAQLAATLGYPKGLSLSAASDIDTTKANISVSFNYMRGFAASVRAAGYKMGGYADEDLAAAMDFDVCCIPGAAYWSPKVFYAIHHNLPLPSYVTMVQHGGPGHGIDVDTLDVYQPFDVWLPSSEGPPRPPHVEIPATVKKGSKGPTVKKAQTRLNVHGARPQLAVDGDFGRLTDKATKAFQKAHKLKADGIIGPITWPVLLAKP